MPLRVKRSMAKVGMSKDQPPFRKQRANLRPGQLRRWRMTLIQCPGVGILQADISRSSILRSITRPRAHIRPHRRPAWLTSTSKICTGTSRPWGTPTRWTWTATLLLGKCQAAGILILRRSRPSRNGVIRCNLTSTTSTICLNSSRPIPFQDGNNLKWVVHTRK